MQQRKAVQLLDKLNLKNDMHVLSYRMNKVVHS
jgi:hypothetical protein